MAPGHRDGTKTGSCSPRCRRRRNFHASSATVRAVRWSRGPTTATASPLKPTSMRPAFSSMRRSGIVASLATAEATAERVRLVWSTRDVHEVRVERALDGAAGAWQQVATLVPNGAGQVVFEDLAIVPGERYRYRLDLANGSWAGEVSIEVPSKRDVRAARRAAQSGGGHARHRVHAGPRGQGATRAPRHRRTRSSPPGRCPERPGRHLVPLGP